MRPVTPRHSAPKRTLLFIAGILLTSASCVPQTLSQQGSQDRAEPKSSHRGFVLHTGTKLVVVDVGVADRLGHPVHGLGATAFSVTEEREAQTLRHFQEVTAQPAHNDVEKVFELPSGTFTNYSSAPSWGTLTVFLLDGLNTSIRDQQHAVEAIEQIADRLPTGGRVAVFGLRSRLYLLQAFSSDTSALKRALQAKAHPNASTLLNDPAGTNSDHATVSDGALADVAPSRTPENNTALLASTLSQFEADNKAFESQLRVQYTLEAFNDLSSYLQNFTGRKNLFWFSSAFPVTIGPDQTAQNPFSSEQSNEAEYRDTLNALVDAQVAVYPVDARGLMSIPLYDASHSGREFAANPSKVNTKLNSFYSSQAVEHQMMEAMAEVTGGRAYYNTNDLAAAVAKGMIDGSNYYSLSYSPTNNSAKGLYRHIFKLNSRATPVSMASN